MQRRSAICLVATALALAPFSAAAQNPPQEPLCRAAPNGDAAEVRRPLDRGVDPAIRDEDGYTPLLRATEITRYGLADEKRPTPDYQAVAALLLARRASVNARTPAGRTPLLGATRGSASEYRVIGADAAMVRLLIDHGADLNAHDNEGWTALLQVSDLWADQPELIRYLIAKGADPKARTRDGRTALMLAARLGKSDRLPLLIDAGAEVNAQDKDGATALMIAAVVRWEEDAADMMKYLVSRHADLNLVDSHGQTAAARDAAAGYL